MPLPILASINETTLVIVLIQLGVIILAARLFGLLFRKFGQPAVVGEIAAGIILGPSVFGKLEVLAGFTNHEISRAIFNPAVADIFMVLAQLGLILMLFLVGLEFEFSHLKQSHRSATAIAITGIAWPFILGLGLAWLIHPYVGIFKKPDGTESPIPFHGFALFMGTAMSITALPVLARMMMDLNVSRTRLAAITIGAAAINDAIGWIILAAVAAVVKSQYDILMTVRMVGLTVAFMVFMLLIARPLLRLWIVWALKKGGGDIGLNSLAILLVIILLSAIATSLIGIFAIFGAFILGAILSDQHQFRDAIIKQLRNFVMIFFLPIYFTYTGLRTDIDALNSPALWLIAAAVCITATLGKFAGCTIAARYTGMKWRESLCVGAFMDTRGLMELIVINLGYEMGVIPRSLYCILVIMALFTTFMTTPLLHLFKRGTELEAPLQSPLAMPRAVLS